MTTPTTPADHAAAASEAIRALINAIYAGHGWESVDDLYRVVGALEELADRAAKVLPHACSLLMRLEARGVLVADSEDPRVHALAALAALEAARAHAASAHSAVAAAHRSLGHLGMREGA